MQLAHRPLFFSFVLMLHREQIVRYCADFIVVLDNPTCNELPPLKDVDLADIELRGRVRDLFKDLVVFPFARHLDSSGMRSTGGNASGFNKNPKASSKIATWTFTCPCGGLNVKKRILNHHASGGLITTALASEESAGESALPCPAYIQISLKGLFKGRAYRNSEEAREVLKAMSLPVSKDVASNFFYLACHQSFDHNHLICNQATLQKRGMLPEVKNFILSKIKSNWRVRDIHAEVISQAKVWASARGHHVQHVLSDASRVPPRHTIYSLRDQFNKEKGSTSKDYKDWVVPLMEKAVEEQKQIDSGLSGARIRILPTNSVDGHAGAWAIAVVTELHLRVSEYFCQSGERLSFDGVHRLISSDNNAVQFTGYVILPCGALPVFHIITNVKAGAVIAAGLDMVKSIYEETLGERAFGGRGASLGPACVVLDGAFEEEMGFRLVWGQHIIFFRCEFHIKRQVIMRSVCIFVM